MSLRPQPWALALAVCVACTAGVARGHSFAPALLVVEERDPGVYDVSWRWTGPGSPATSDLGARVPAGCHRASPPSAAGLMRIDCGPSGLAGKALSATGLDARSVEGVVMIRQRRGPIIHGTLHTDGDRFVVPGGGHPEGVFWRYTRLGVHHILGGLDHLLFLIGLLLLVRGVGPLIRVVTAFTLAHSVTLALAAVGVVNLPSAPVEALIALSIVVLAAELVRDPRAPRTLARRYPTLLCGCFGLLHGLGFAGSLREVGLPPDAVPAALLSFNLGVEAGQLLVVTSFVIARPVVARLRLGLPLGRAAPFALGGAGAAWFLDRCFGLWGR